MPSAADFKRAFGLGGKSKALGSNFKVDSCHVGHEVRSGNARQRLGVAVAVFDEKAACHLGTGCAEALLM